MFSGRSHAALYGSDFYAELTDFKDARTTTPSGVPFSYSLTTRGEIVKPRTRLVSVDESGLRSRSTASITGPGLIRRMQTLLPLQGGRSAS